MRRLLPLAAVLLAVVLTTGACTLQTVGAPTGDVTLNATFDDVQSLVAGHSVQVADVRIGTVTDVRLQGYRAKVTMSLQRRIPDGTTAKIAKTSILGENYVSLILPPGRGMTSGPFLPNGATIARTSVEPDIEQVTEKAGPLIDALSAQDVNAVLDAAANAFGGRGAELNKLIRDTTEITSTYDRSREDIATTIDNLARLGHDLAKGSPQLDALPVTLDRATTRLVHGRHHIKQTLVSLTDFARAGNKIFYPRHAARLRTLLTRLDAITNSMVRGKDDLKALIAQLQRWIDAPPITANGQLLIYVWLKGLITDTPAKTPSLLNLLEPPK
ncbi:MCE family protein [Streptosporangiaceae bacterium NEAU-GS5]|nr:MCE family protein [Streptosporangiaceae bacterium NEAU-GS5]